MDCGKIVDSYVHGMRRLYLMTSTYHNCRSGFESSLVTVIDVFVHMNKRTAVTRTAPSQG